MKSFSKTMIVCAAVTQLMAPGIGLAGQDTVPVQKPAKKALKLEDIVVTATRSPKEKKELPQVVNVITTKDIKETVATDLTDVLKETASVDVIQYPGALSGISIRGFRPEFLGTTKHTLLLIDGRPAGATNLATIPLDNIQRIEVLKGPASALYGSEAMGGVVNVITKESRGKIKSHLTLGYGSFSTWQVKAASGGNLTRKLDFDLDVSTDNQNGDLRMGNGDKRDHTAFKKRYGSARFGYAFNQDWRMDVHGDWFAGRDIEVPGDIFYGTTQQSRKDINRYGGDAKISGFAGENNEISLTFYRSREDSEYHKEYTGIVPYKNYESTTDWIGAQLQDTYYFSVHSLTFGIDYERIKVTSQSYNSDSTRRAPYMPDNEHKTAGIFSQAMLKFFNNRLIATMGARYDAITLETKATPYKTDFTPGSADFSTFNPSGGLKFFLTPQWQLHATIGTAFVTPKPEEVAGHWVNWWGGTTEGNPNLDPEKSLTWDSGISFDKKEWGLSSDLTYFHTKVDDKIEKVAVTSTLSTYENTQEAKIRGLEGQFSLNVGRLADWHSSLRLFANFTKFFKDEETLSTGSRDIHNVADFKINYGLGYDDGHFFNGRITARYVGHMKDTDWNAAGYPEIEYPTHTVVDLVTNFKLTSHQTLSLKVGNLFDKYYYEKKGFPLAGRSFFGTYTFEF